MLAPNSSNLDLTTQLLQTLAQESVYDIPLDQIIILPDRGRKKFINIETLAESIKTSGQIQPIVLRHDLTLVAGERRYRATKLAGKLTIRAIFRDLSDLEAKLLELAENQEREAMTWQEEVILVKQIQQLTAQNGGSPTVRSTAECIHRSIGYVSEALQLAHEIESNNL